MNYQDTTYLRQFENTLRGLIEQGQHHKSKDDNIKRLMKGVAEILEESEDLKNKNRLALEANLEWTRKERSWIERLAAGEKKLAELERRQAEIMARDIPIFGA